jgi:K+-transporting ATPase ATPase C chain
VAKARGLALDRVQALLEANTEKRELGIFGESGVNVLRLNIALDNASATQPTGGK